MAATLRANGDILKEILNRVQNHHADNSVALEHPVFSYMLRQWFSTVRTEIYSRSAISFLAAPHAVSSAISVSRWVSLTFEFILFIPPYLRDTVLVEYSLDGLSFAHFWFDYSI